MRILVTGAGGNLGAYLVDALLAAHHRVIAWTGTSGVASLRGNFTPVDLTGTSWPDELDRIRPETIFHLAAISSAEAALRDPSRALAVNATATRHLAEWCAREGRPLVYTSTDMVFDGTEAWYREDSPPCPALEYGRTKRDGEVSALIAPCGLVARLPLLFGPSRCGRPSFFDRAMEDLREGRPRTFFEDEFRTPLDYATAAGILAKLPESGATGLLHVAGAERMSRFELMRRVARAMGLDEALIRANRRSEAPSSEPRPADLSLETSKLAALLPNVRRPTIEEAIV